MVSTQTLPSWSFDCLFTSLPLPSLSVQNIPDLPTDVSSFVWSDLIQPLPFSYFLYSLPQFHQTSPTTGLSLLTSPRWFSLSSSLLRRFVRTGPVLRLGRGTRVHRRQSRRPSAVLPSRVESGLVGLDGESHVPLGPDLLSLLVSVAQVGPGSVARPTPRPGRRVRPAVPRPGPPVAAGPPA